MGVKKSELAKLIAESCEEFNIGPPDIDKFLAYLKAKYSDDRPTSLDLEDMLPSMS